MACRKVVFSLGATFRTPFSVTQLMDPVYCPTFQTSTHKRHLSIHEYQNMKILSKYGIEIPKGEVADSPEMVRMITDQLGGRSVVKAQVLAGGRGKGTFTGGLQGGVHIAKSTQEAVGFAEQMLGGKLVTKQTGKRGRPCNKVLVNEMLQPLQEYYFAIVIDRTTMGPCIIASREGGVDIEETAQTKPDAIVKQPIDIHTGVTDEVARDVATRLGFAAGYHDKAVEQFLKLYQVFTDLDCTMLEINPLTEDANGQVICMDVKMNFDDTAAYRHKEIFDLRDWSQEDPREVQATQANLNYIGLDGDIGCLVNGAGLAMATMDLIQHHGGSPANFLDIGGGASTEEVENAFRVINSDKKVKAILVNIFGGIIKCDEIAQGIITASKTLNLELPMVVRLQGTNFQVAKNMIESSGLKINACEHFGESARMVVDLARQRPV